MNIADLRRRAARQPAALRVLAAARRRGLEVLSVDGHLRYHRRAAFDAGLLGELVTHEVEIVVILEWWLAILYRAALRRCWTAMASGYATTIARAVDELARRLDDVGTTRGAAIRHEVETGR